MTTTAWNNASGISSITACCGQTCSSMDATGGNSANYHTYLTGVTTVGTNGGPSYYGTYDQSGNAAEWVEQGLLAGGHWNTREGALGRLSPSDYQRPSLLGNRGRGFRLTYSYPDVILPNFPVPATSISIDNFVSVDDPGNIMDTTSLGSVPLLFYIKKYEVTNLEYVNFLNAVASDSDRHDLFNPRIMPCGKRPGIIRTGQAGSYIYSCGPYMENKPVVGISWFNAARMANWLSNGSPPSSDINVLNSTEQGAYTMESVDKLPVTRNMINPNNKYPPIYRLPTLNEWYKAAYFDPDKNSGSAGYWQYATQDDQAPDPVLANDRYDGISQYIGAQGTDCSQDAALIPAFGPTTSTADGFTVQITNYDDLFLWGGSATTGQVNIDTTTGLLTVTGVSANTSSTAMITTRRTGYFDGLAGITASALMGTALNPTFTSTTSTATGFTAQITNYNSSYTWAGTATASGLVSISSSGFVTVYNVAAGTSSTATITTTRAGHDNGSTIVTDTSVVGTARNPAFGGTTRTATGFTVQISNYDAAYTWAGTATASGTVAISGTGLVTVTGVAAATSVTATITTTRAGYVGGTADVTQTSRSAALTPGFGSTTATTSGFTVQISNYDAAYTWAGTATASGRVEINGSGFVTVTNVAAATSVTATITTTRAGYVGGTAPVTATSLGAARNPTFGTKTPTTTGFTVQISNYDAAYTWAGTATASGSVAISGTGLVTVTNVAVGTSSTATITTTRAGYVGGTAPVTATSLTGAALNPTFVNTTSTATGFTVQISNYDGAYDWAGTLNTTLGSVSISNTGLVTVTGLAAGRTVIAQILSSRSGYGLGRAYATGSSLLAALVPTFGVSTPTATGFTVQISNYSSAYTWAGTATASGSVSISNTGLVTVTNVAVATSSTITITATLTGYATGSATKTARSLSSAGSLVISMVTVGNPGNTADVRTGRLYGAVNYSYRIGMYEVKCSEYTAFLNAVAVFDSYALWHTSMSLDTRTAQISRSGTYNGNYTYAVMNNTGDRPISYVSWLSCARFCNWMSNGQPTGPQNAATTERGAYALDGTSNSSAYAIAKNTINPNTGLAPTFWIPLENEWYKAAYYSPNYGGTGVGGYYLYATKNDSAPGANPGAGINQANYNNQITHTTNAGEFSNSASFYGTFDQTGNVSEWNDLNILSTARLVRGGGWSEGAFVSSSSYRVMAIVSNHDYQSVGFRIAGSI